MKAKPPKDALRASRKGSRDAEIGLYDHPIPHHKVHRSKKQYNRKIAKARLKKGEPLFCPGNPFFANFRYLYPTHPNLYSR